MLLRINEKKLEISENSAAGAKILENELQNNQKISRILTKFTLAKENSPPCFAPLKNKGGNFP